MQNTRISRYLGMALAILFVVALAGCAKAAATPTVAPVAQATTAPATATKPAAALPTATVVQPTATKPAPTATAVQPTAAPTRPQPTATTAAVSGGSALDAVIKAGRAQLAAKAWRINMTTESGTTTSKNVIEFVPPDRFHMLGDTEMIIIGAKAYIKQGATWMQFPMDVSTLIGQFTNSKMIEDIEKGITDAKLVGPDMLNGKAMLVYTFNQAYAVAGVQIVSAVKLWVGVTDGLPYKQESQSEISGVKSATTSLLEYPTDLKIESPIP